MSWLREMLEIQPERFPLLKELSINDDDYRPKSNYRRVRENVDEVLKLVDLAPYCPYLSEFRGVAIGSWVAVPVWLSLPLPKHGASRTTMPVMMEPRQVRY